MAERGQRGLTVPRLHAWRLDRVMTQEELAASAGVSRGTVARAELGAAISLANVRKLATALGISPSQLLHQDSVDMKAKGAA